MLPLGQKKSNVFYNLFLTLPYINPNFKYMQKKYKGERIDIQEHKKQSLFKYKLSKLAKNN